MKEFVKTPLGLATLSICGGLLLAAWPPGLAMFLAGGLLAFGGINLRRAFRRGNDAITLGFRSGNHDATHAGTAIDLAAGDDRRVSSHS